jgi:hypothetical protein
MFGIEIMGNVELDPNHDFKLDDRMIFPNSIQFFGGFMVNHEKWGEGIGRETIRRIFEVSPEIQNIFLYANNWNSSIPFWLKVGGEVILGNKEERHGLVYIQIKRENVR